MKNLWWKILKSSFALLVAFALPLSAAQAIEITAIDFNGDLLGKVIPDGKVVSFDNQLIGNITADSLILDFNGKLIGGVVPQGIAIGNDNRLLGKVNNDGSVRVASGKIIGKALPNGLVVDDYFNVIGAVLFPGLVYSDDGKTVGRLTGDGAYANLQGQTIGFLTPDGYAYRRNGNDISLDGRLISSKMIISPDGKFIGSIVPGGQITDFDGKNIGFIHANGLAYNDKSEVIGRLVRSGYAFDDYGKYIGFVMYNGEVVNSEGVIGHLLIDGRVADLDGKPMGFSLDINSTATDNDGKYLGRLMPDGKIAQSKDTVGTIGARGVVLDKDQKVIGKIVSTGPVFDYKGNIIAHALKDGAAISLGGSRLGYVTGSDMYEYSGLLAGKLFDFNHIIGVNNTPLGIAGISGRLSDNTNVWQSSPFGYVYNANGTIGGQVLYGLSVYGANGGFQAYVDANGRLADKGAPLKAVLTQSGIAINDNGSVLGGTAYAKRAQTFAGNLLGGLANGNQVIDDKGNMLAKILPDKSIVSATSSNSAELNPLVGHATTADIAIDVKGGLLGFITPDGRVKDTSGLYFATSTGDGSILDNNGRYIGAMQDYRHAINSECELLGSLTPSNTIRNFRGVNLGKSLPNGHVVNDKGDFAGYLVRTGAVVDFNGKLLGSVSADGHVLTPKGDNLGCINFRSRLLNSAGEFIGGMVTYAPVMSFNHTIIGRSIIDGRIVNPNNQFIGYVRPDGDAMSDNASSIGNLFLYKFAFDNQNKFMGRINSQAEVIGSDGKPLGNVDFNGYVLKDKEKIGYALYDLYIYDNANKTLGYIGSDGSIISLGGDRLGELDRGFWVDKNGTVLGRGNRDYKIRSDSNQVLGELQMSGILLDYKGQELGKLGSEGHLLDSDGNLLATADPLQYYNVTFNREKVYDAEGNVVGYLANEGNVYDETGKLIGKLNADGTVSGPDGSILGGIGTDWYEKVKLPDKIDKTLPTVGVHSTDALDVDLEKRDFRKSLNIALTPDGEYLGDILEDGRVVDKNGNYLGRRMPDGLIIDDDGNLIGIEEVQKPEGGEMFVPAGTFGPGGAYGIGTGPGGNLGPGGGFGAGERYDPQRAAALAAAQQARRQSMGVGHVASNIKKESFDGYQKNWDNEGVNKTISSWRVDMSEMILADKPIPAVIARSIDSNNPTPVTAYVERNVYAEEGRNIIIPAGSRLLGTLNSMVANTETTSQSAKVQISWERLIRPDGILFTFQGITADAMGRGGALGYLDQQLFKKYTLPVMTTALTSYTAYMMAPDDNSENEVETPKQQAANDARQNFLTQMNEVFSEILSDKSNIRPLTYVPAGTRIIVYPNVDLWLRTPERDDEQSSGGKRNLFIDDKEVSAQINAEQAAKNNSVSASVGGVDAGDQVLYQSNGGNYTPADSPKLIDDAKVTNQIRAQQAARQQNSGINGALPPPPPSSSTTSTPALVSTTPSGSGSSSGSSSANNVNNNSVPQLF